MILYHASDKEVRNPEIRKAVYAKDFGFGFYCTANYEQAERWSKRGRNLVSIINHYEFETIEGLAVFAAIVAIAASCVHAAASS
jgi:hypothetical protein